MMMSKKFKNNCLALVANSILCSVAGAAIAVSIVPGEGNAAQTNRQIATNGKQAKLSEVKAPQWWQQREKKDVLHVIVDKTMQRVSVYSNGELISQSNVSTGKAGHTTPNGIYSIMEKRRRHFSNIYRGASMPYMQRLTWSGIALHQSNSVPAYPASHGCVRMPRGFAGKLFQFTNRGAQVIISNRNVRPVPIESDKLPKGGENALLASSQLRPAAVVITGGVEAKQSSGKAELKPAIPARVLITRFTGRERVKAIQELLNELKYDAGEPDGYMGRQTGQAIIGFQKDYRHKVTGGLTEDLLAQLYRATGLGKPKEGRLYVRVKQKPVFDMPVVINDPKTPLGTHQFTAVRADSEAETQKLNWLAVSIEQAKWKGLDENSPAPSTARTALERIELPKQAKQKLDELINAGSTIVIADGGYARETGKGTDFIIQTK